MPTSGGSVGQWTYQAPQGDGRPKSGKSVVEGFDDIFFFIFSMTFAGSLFGGNKLFLSALKNHPFQKWQKSYQSLEISWIFKPVSGAHKLQICERNPGD